MLRAGLVDSSRWRQQQISRGWGLSQRLEEAEHRRLQRLIRECASAAKRGQEANSGTLAQCLSAHDFCMPPEVWHSILSCSWYLSVAHQGFS